MSVLKEFTPSIAKPVPYDTPIEFHVLNTIRLGCHYYVECSCREWVSEALDTIQQAHSIEQCEWERLRFESQRNIQAYRLAAVHEAHLNRMFPTKGRV